MRKEFAAIPESSRASVWRAANARLRFNLWIVVPAALWLLAFPKISLLLREVLVPQLESTLGDSAGTVVGGSALLLVLGAQIGTLRLMRPEMQRVLREEIRTHGIRVCVACGYDLRGDPETRRCPECGQVDVGARPPEESS